MVIHTALCVVNTAVAWGFALLFIRRKRAEICFDAFLCAAVHGLLCYVVSGTIKEEAGRYHGTVYTRMEGSVVHFVAKIPINLAKKQEDGL